jgi:hypothetical protein
MTQLLYNQVEILTFDISMIQFLQQYVWCDDIGL